MLDCIDAEPPSRRDDILLVSESYAENSCQYDVPLSYDRVADLSIEYQLEFGLSEGSKSSASQHSLDVYNDGAKTFQSHNFEEWPSHHGFPVLCIARGICHWCSIEVHLHLLHMCKR